MTRYPAMLPRLMNVGFRTSPNVTTKDNKRNRPEEPFGTAMAFIALAVDHQAKKKEPITKETVFKLHPLGSPLFRRFAGGIKLRGKEKARVERIVIAQLAEARG